MLTVLALSVVALAGFRVWRRYAKSARRLEQLRRFRELAS